MPIKTSGYRAEMPYVAPLLGEHNGEILAELRAMESGEIEDLMARGVLATAAT